MTSVDPELAVTAANAVEPVKKRATLQDKIDALDWYHSREHPSQNVTVAHFQHLNRFSITRSSFNRWIKQEDELRRIYSSTDIAQRSTLKTFKQIKHTDDSLFKKCMGFYYEQAMVSGCVDLDDPKPGSHAGGNVPEFQIAKTFENFQRLLTGEAKSPSNGWIYHFKTKYLARKQVVAEWKQRLEQQRVTSIDLERERLQRELLDYPISDIYHVDEFIVSNQVHFGWSQQPGVPELATGSRDQVIVVLCCNASGTDIPQPLVIGSREAHEEPNYYQNTRLTPEIFQELVAKLDARVGRKVALLCDALYQHCIAQDTLKHVKLIYFNQQFAGRYSPLYETGKNKLEIQPLNMGVVRHFKQSFRLALLDHHLLSSKEEPFDAHSKVSHSQFLRLVSFAHSQLNAELVAQCFSRSGILPPSPETATVASDGNAVPQYVFDHEKELLLMKMYEYLQSRGFIPQMPPHVELSIDDHILFPHCEFVRNQVFSAEQIVEIVTMATLAAEPDTIESSEQDLESLIKLNTELNAIKGLASRNTATLLEHASLALQEEITTQQFGVKRVAEDDPIDKLLKRARTVNRRRYNRTSEWAYEIAVERSPLQKVKQLLESASQEKIEQVLELLQ